MTALERTSTSPSAVRAAALDWAGYLSNELGEDGGALAEQAVACARAAEAPATLALALCHLPHVAFEQGQVDEAILLIEEALAIAEQAGDPFTLGTVLNNLGASYYERGDRKRTLTLHEESYRVRAEMGDLSRMALSLSNLARELYEDDASRAHDLGTKGLVLAREVGDRRHIGTSLSTLGWMALAEDHLNEARDLLEESLAVALDIAFHFLMYEGLVGLAAVAGADGDWRLAARLEAAVESYIRVDASGLGPWEKGLLDKNRAVAQAQTDPAEWEATWAAGATLTIEQAVAEVLKI